MLRLCANEGRWLCLTWGIRATTMQTRFDFSRRSGFCDVQFLSIGVTPWTGMAPCVVTQFRHLAYSHFHYRPATAPGPAGLRSLHFCVLLYYSTWPSSCPSIVQGIVKSYQRIPANRQVLTLCIVYRTRPDLADVKFRYSGNDFTRTPLTRWPGWTDGFA